MVAISIKYLGHRKTSLMGATFTTSGFLLSALFVHLELKQIILFYFATGGLAGMGFGLMYLPAMSVIDHWFSNNMGLATGIAAAGSGIGQFTLGASIFIEIIFNHLLQLHCLSGFSIVLDLLFLLPSLDALDVLAWFIPWFIEFLKVKKKSLKLENQKKTTTNLVVSKTFTTLAS